MDIEFFAQIPLWKKKLKPKNTDQNDIIDDDNNGNNGNTGNIGDDNNGHIDDDDNNGNNGNTGGNTGGGNNTGGNDDNTEGDDNTGGGGTGGPGGGPDVPPDNPQVEGHWVFSSGAASYHGDQEYCINVPEELGPDTKTTTNVTYSASYVNNQIVWNETSFSQDIYEKNGDDWEYIMTAQHYNGDEDDGIEYGEYPDVPTVNWTDSILSIEFNNETDDQLIPASPNNGDSVTASISSNGSTANITITFVANS